MACCGGASPMEKPITKLTFADRLEAGEGPAGRAAGPVLE